MRVDGWSLDTPTVVSPKSQGEKQVLIYAGQGTWYALTHRPEKVIGAAPVSGYSSIEGQWMFPSMCI